ncbi:MAG: 3-ketoacyl-ACP reductase [Planctomycetota bacterium]|nr:3-ketoacyl-ACP reductase [Planctomycetota bacterium]
MSREDRPVALITGASRGIGRAIALELARGGFDLAANATSWNAAQRESGLAEVEDRVMELGAAFEPVPGDLAELADHDRIVAATLNRFGRIDLLVNNAGIAPQPRVDIMEMPPESYDRVMAVNARGTFFLTQRIVRSMLEAIDRGSAMNPVVIFISSVSAVASSVNRAEYCISKAAISRMAQLFADRLAAHGIRVYEIRPGIIRTEMTAPVRETYDRRIAEGLIPQQRWGEPEDIAKVVAQLAGDSLAYATGIVLEISGGMNIRRL